MQSGEQFVMTTGIFKMPGWSVSNWDIQMLWKLHYLHNMDKELDQFGWITCTALEMSLISSRAHIMKLATRTVNMIKMLQLNVQVH